MELPALVALIALAEYIYFGFQVGFNRQKFDVMAPAVSGNEQWERYYRVQQNTLEQLVVFIPSLLIFAIYIGPVSASVIGLFFVVGRAIYYVSYVKEPASRSLGFMIGFIASTVLMLGGAGGAIYSLINV